MVKRIDGESGLDLNKRPVKQPFRLQLVDFRGCEEE